jgi:choline dehydrogenase
MSEAFDYVVVGAGTAGCVVASRLAADARRRVLLLEAGGSERRFWVQLPIGYGRTFNDPRVNWMYAAEADPALAGRSAFWPRGKLLGGSGSINAMVYVRGLPQDYDDWRELGNPGWGFDDVRPYFERAEQRIHVSDVSADTHAMCQAYIESCRGLGYGFTEDFNGPHGEGVGFYRITTRGGRRESTARSYLRPLLRRQMLRRPMLGHRGLRRPGLSLRLHAHALRILFDGKRAAGVRYLQSGSTLEARADKGVILCAGAINSPQLLQLSGIGPAALLHRLGLELVAESPAVGRNLQDHLAVSYLYRSNVPTLNDQLLPWRGKIRAAAHYLVSRRGPLAMSVNQAGGFVRSDASQPRPNLQLYFNPMSYAPQPGGNRRLLNPDPFSAFLLSFNSCRPTSRGHLEIRSANPFDAPAIHPNSLATEHDLTEVNAGTHLLRTIAASAPLCGFVESEIRPGASVQTDAQRLQDFRARGGSVFHPVSTCRMGPDPATAVVDARLNVYGVQALRIVDASIFPSVTSGNTNAPTIMVAEKAAALLAEDA